MASKTLTAKFLEKALAGKAEPGRYYDGDRLHLWVRNGPGKPSWIFRYTTPATGKKRDLSFGAADSVGLAQARRLAHQAREDLALGRDPIEVRQLQLASALDAREAKRAEATSAALTLRVAAHRTHESLESKFANPKHRQQWINSVTQHIPAYVLDKPVAAVTASDLLDCLPPLMRRTPETGRRVRQRLEQIFDEAILRQERVGNPARDVRRVVAEKQTKQHFAALPWEDVPLLLKRIAALPGHSARALEFGVLTAARTEEILGARWSEFDLAAGLWTVPAPRTKAREEHRVYLSPRAVEILRGMAGLNAEFVFPSVQKGKENSPMSNMAMLNLLKRLKINDRTTVHGLCRSSFSTWANEHGYRADVVEACLAHREADRVRAAYNRAQFTDARRALMVDWARFVSGESGKMVTASLGLGRGE